MGRQERGDFGKTTPFSMRANGDVGTRASLFPGRQTNNPAWSPLRGSPDDGVAQLGQEAVCLFPRASHTGSGAALTMALEEQR